MLVNRHYKEPINSNFRTWKASRARAASNRLDEKGMRFWNKNFLLLPVFCLARTRGNNGYVRFKSMEKFFFRMNSRGASTENYKLIDPTLGVIKLTSIF